MEVVYTSKFIREYKKLPVHVKVIAEEQEIIFCNDPFDSRLKTHKLSGRLADFYSFSIGYRYRIIFEFSADKKSAYFYSVGNHDIYHI